MEEVPWIKKHKKPLFGSVFYISICEIVKVWEQNYFSSFYSSTLCYQHTLSVGGSAPAVERKYEPPPSPPPPPPLFALSRLGFVVRGKSPQSTTIFSSAARPSGLKRLAVLVVVRSPRYFLTSAAVHDIFCISQNMSLKKCRKNSSHVTWKTKK